MITPLSEIVALAKDPTPSGRCRLASCFGESFFDNATRYSPQEKALALDIMSALIRDAEIEIRRELAYRFAAEPAMPHALAVALANDTAIDVAKPIIIHSPVLRDDDLIGIIESKSSSYRLAIAKRAHLAPTVSEALVSTGESGVAMTLLQNITVHLTEKTIRMLAAQTLEQVELSHILIQRPEMTTELAEKLYWLVSKELRENISRKFKFDEKSLDAALEATVSGIIAKSTEQHNQRTLADRLLASGAVTPALMIELLKSRGVPLYLDLLQGMTGLPRDAVEVLCRPTMCDSLALVCRAYGFTRTETASLLMLTRDRLSPDGKFDPTGWAAALSSFDHLTVGDAKTVLWQWQSDPSYLTNQELNAA